MNCTQCKSFTCCYFGTFSFFTRLQLNKYLYSHFLSWILQFLIFITNLIIVRLFEFVILLNMYSVLQTTNFRTPASMKGCVFFPAIGMKLIKDRTLYLICVRKLQGITLDQSCSDGKTFSKAFVSAICVCTGRKRYNAGATTLWQSYFRNSGYSRHTWRRKKMTLILCYDCF